MLYTVYRGAASLTTHVIDSRSGGVLAVSIELLHRLLLNIKSGKHNHRQAVLGACHRTVTQDSQPQN